MYVQCAFKNIKDTDRVKSYALSKIESKVQKLVSKPIGVNLRVQDEGNAIRTECRLNAGDGLSVQVSNDLSGGNSLFEAIDKLIDKLERVLKKRMEHQSQVTRKNVIDKKVFTEELHALVFSSMSGDSDDEGYLEEFENMREDWTVDKEERELAKLG